jgi:4-amino-4-deoxy-L-arabinose transferase-like glycosyltransferase
MSAAVDSPPGGGAAMVDGAGPPRRRVSVGLVVAGGVALFAALIPPTAVVRWLVGAESPLFDRVVAGVVVFKAVLLLHAIVVPLIARMFDRSAPGQALVAPVHEREPVTPTLLGLLAATLVLGLGLRLVDLGAGLWHDEIATLVEFGRLPLREIVATYTAQNQHVLYSVLTSLTFGAAGESAWALRLPSALMGAASLGAVFWFGSIVTSRSEALLATLLLAVSYHHVWFSQNARGYTGMMLFALIATGLLVRMLTGDARRVWPVVVAYAIAMALAVWIHLTAAFIAGAHMVVWLGLLVRARGRLRGAWPWAPVAAIALAASFTILLYALVLPQMTETLFTPATEFAGETPWQNPIWLVTETLRGAARGLPGGWIGLAGGMTVAVAGAISYLRRSATVAWLMLLPGLVTAAVLVGTGHNLWPRFFFFAAGFAILIAVRGAFALTELLPLRGRRRAIATAALVLGAAASATTVPGAWAPKQDYAGALAYVRNDTRPGDVTVAAGLAAYAYESWLRSDVRPVSDVTELEQAEMDGSRTWLLYTMPEHLAGQAPALWSKIESDYREVLAFPGTIAGGTVHVMMRR